MDVYRGKAEAAINHFCSGKCTAASLASPKATMTFMIFLLLEGLQLLKASAGNFWGMRTLNASLVSVTELHFVTTFMLLILPIVSDKSRHVYRIISHLTERSSFPEPIFGIPSKFQKRSSNKIPWHPTPQIFICNHNLKTFCLILLSVAIFIAESIASYTS